MDGRKWRPTSHRTVSSGPGIVLPVLSKPAVALSSGARGQHEGKVGVEAFPSEEVHIGVWCGSCGPG